MASLWRCISEADMDETRVTSVELHKRLGELIDRAMTEPVMVTKHNRDHVVLISAEQFATLRMSARKARKTGSLTAEERAAASAAQVPSRPAQKRYLKKLAAAVEEMAGQTPDP